MTKAEYDLIQAELSGLLDQEKLCRKGITNKESDTYRAAILAAKSLINNLYSYQLGGTK